MLNTSTLKRIERFIAPYRVTQGQGFRLADIDPADTHRLGAEDKGDAKTWLSEGVSWLAQEQDLLYAQDRWSVLLVFQAMDAAGKDGTIKHVMSGVNPQGCQVFSFKQPSAESIDSFSVDSLRFAEIFFAIKRPRRRGWGKRLRVASARWP
jgi:polyphosphate kinase 2 (PPK2 family)